MKTLHLAKNFKNIFYSQKSALQSVAMHFLAFTQLGFGGHFQAFTLTIVSQIKFGFIIFTQ